MRRCFLHPNYRGLFLERPGRDLAKSQALTLVDDFYRAIDLLMNHDPGSTRPVLNLVNFPVMRYRKVIPKRSFRLDTQNRIQVHPGGEWPMKVTPFLRTNRKPSVVQRKVLL